MTKLVFSTSDFGYAMYTQSGITLDDYDPSHYGWESNSNQSMQYSHNDSNYQTWRQDTSLCRNSLAILVSCKIDYLRGSKDDHLVLFASFNRDLHIIAAQAAIQSIKYDGTATTDIIVAKPPAGGYPSASTDGQVATDLQNSVLRAIQDDILKGSNDDGFEDLYHVAYYNLICMQKAVKLQ